ncbi:MAG: hypothetical protein AMS17_03075 [Spirochaetes bacterium DG_61]|nr:MAG: hypothetical protein AMS17_03075 [Spirochaetes bacterium DG_61]
MYSVVIMAGGKGERFWPRSVRKKPKQFHRIVSERTMIQETFYRVYPEIKKEHIYVVAGKDFSELILEQLPDLPEGNLIVEPEAKNTAAAIGLAAVELARKDPRGTMVVLTADHVIKPKEEFLRACEVAVQVAVQGSLVTFGMLPDRPATEYGYIEIGQKRQGWYDLEVFNVKMFREKPSLDKARAYIAEGRFLWNSGMFAFTFESILQAIETHMPSLHASLMCISRSIGSADEDRVKKEVFSGLQSISIDYGVMEKFERIACVKPRFFWDDVGSWGTLSRHRQADSKGNIHQGNVISVDGSNNIVMGEEESIICLVGISDVIVVKDGPRLLVCNRSQDQRVKEVLKVLSSDEKYKPFC